MTTGRVEAFSDAVVAIIMTIMVLELRPPHDPSLASLRPLVPVLGSYLLSFVFLGLYWNNHHHLLHAAAHINGQVLWTNLHLLFWLSLIPFVTAWMGDNHFEKWPMAMYGIILLCAGIAYFILVRALLALEANKLLSNALGNGIKEKFSIVGYLLAIARAFLPWIAFAIYVLIAVTWLVPDRRIEQRVTGE